jgi:hypothetical protein
MDAPQPPVPVKPLRKHLAKLGIACVAVAALVLAVLFLPGVGLRWGVVKLLHRAGMAEVSLSGGDLSLFGKRIIVQGMAAQPKEGRPLHLDDLTLLFHWLPVLDRRLSMERVSLKGLTIAVEHRDGSYVVNGLPLPVPSAGGESGKRPWLYGVEKLQLADSRVDYVDGPTETVLDIDNLTVEKLRRWEPDTPTGFHLAGRLNGAPVAVDGTATPFAEHPQFNLHLTVEGLALTTAGLAERLTGLSGLTGAGDADVTVAGQPGRFQLDGRLAVHRLAWHDGDRQLQAESAEWSGHAQWGGAAQGQGQLGLAGMTTTLGATSITLPKADLRADRLEWAQGRLHWEGTAEAQGASLAVADMTVGGRQVRLQGRVDFGGAGSEGAPPPVSGALTTHIDVSGALTMHIDGLSASDRKRGVDWLAADHLDAGSLSLAADSAVAERLSLAGVAALRRQPDGGGYPWRLELREARTDRLSVGWSGALGLGEVQLDGALLRLQRTKEGWLGSDALSRQEGSGGPSERLSLAKLVVGGQSRVLFEDQTTADPVRLRIDAVEATLGGLDTGAPAQDSPFVLKARVDGAPVSVQGRVRLFAQPTSAEIRGEVHGLELPPLSPYAAAGLGVPLKTGHLDGRATVTLKEHALDGRMQLVLAKLLVAPPDPNAPIVRKTQLPMDTVLDLLRDRDGVIHLEIPVSGALDSPNFDVSDAVNQAVAGALRATAATTLQVLFPVAALISLVDNEAEGRHLALAPLPFDPGQDVLTDEHRAKLAGVASLLRERPGLKLTLCGVASAESDWPVLAERRRKEQEGMLSKLQGLLGVNAHQPPPPADRGALIELAERRSLVVKNALAGDSGIDPARLFSCRGSVETAPAHGGPRVDLLL